MDMKKTRLGDVVTVINGKNQRLVENPAGKYPIYGSGGVMGYADSFICPPDTVVIGRKGNINKPIYVTEPFWNVDTAFGLVSDSSKLLPRYLYHFCRFFDFERLNSTVTIPSLTKRNLQQVEIPLVDISDQYHFVAILDAIEQQITFAKQMLAKTDELVQSRFMEMFGSYGEETTRLLGEVAVVQTGATPSRANAAYYGGGIPWVKTGEINYTTIMQSAETISAAALRETNCKLFPAGTILIAMYGQGDTRGRAGVLGISAATNQACAAVLLDVEQCDNLFMLQQLRMKYDELRGLSLGGNQKNLSLGIIKAMPVVLPPIELQREFAAFVRQVESLKTDLNQQLDRLNTLYDSLTQRYFA